MNLNEFITKLKEMEEEHGPDCPVCIITGGGMCDEVSSVMDGESTEEEDKGATLILIW